MVTSVVGIFKEHRLEEGCRSVNAAKEEIHPTHTFKSCKLINISLPLDLSSVYSARNPNENRFMYESK